MSEMKKGNGGQAKNASGKKRIGVSNPAAHRSSSSSGGSNTRRPSGPTNRPDTRPPRAPERPRHRPPMDRRPMDAPPAPPMKGRRPVVYNRPPRQGRKVSTFGMILSAAVVLIVVLFALLSR